MKKHKEAMMNIGKPYCERSAIRYRILAGRPEEKIISTPLDTTRSSQKSKDAPKQKKPSKNGTQKGGNPRNEAEPKKNGWTKANVRSSKINGEEVITSVDESEKLTLNQVLNIKNNICRHPYTQIAEYLYYTFGRMFLWWLVCNLFIANGLVAIIMFIFYRV